MLNAGILHPLGRMSVLASDFRQFNAASAIIDIFRYPALAGIVTFN